MKQRSALYILLVVGGLSLVSCNSGMLFGPTPTSKSIQSTPIPVSPTESITLPKPGKWIATAEFGEFTFVVNSKSTGVNEYDFGGINIKTSDDEGYPIKDLAFGSMLDFIKIEGTFDSSTTASGTWRYLKKGGSGTWTAIWAG